MEASLVNIFRNDDTVLVLSSGKFGERWRDMANRFGLKVIFNTEEAGKSIDVDRAKQLIENNRINGVLTTLTDTSTGVTNDIKSIASFTREKGIPLIVDAVSGFLADPLKMDDWGVDVVAGGSQKSLGCPPGIGFVGIRKQAWKFVENSNLPKYYWDFPAYRLFAEKGQTPYTPAIPIFFALQKSLQKIDNINSLWNKFSEIAQSFRNKMKEINISIFPEKPSNALTIIEANNRSNEIIEYIVNKYKILFANGQKELKGKIIRISHMGHLNKEDLELSFNAIKDAWEVLKI